MEDLIYYSPKHYKIFSQVLRDLFDSLHSSVLFFMNFTLAESEESTIELILGGAVWSRITKKIRYKQFTEKNAFDYCNELLTRSKIDSTIPIALLICNRKIILYYLATNWYRKFSLPNPWALCIRCFHQPD